MAKKKKRKVPLPRRRANPRGAAEPQREIEKAAELFRAFREEEPGKVTAVSVQLPRASLMVGDIDAIAYRTYENGKRVKYLHTFKPTARPKLLAGYDGRTLIIYGGNFTFTPRGIVDRG